MCVCVFWWMFCFHPLWLKQLVHLPSIFPTKNMLQALDPSTWGAWPVATPQIQSPLLPPCPTTVWWPPWAYESHCHLGSRKVGGGLEAWGTSWNDKSLPKISKNKNTLQSFRSPWTSTKLNESFKSEVLGCLVVLETINLHYQNLWRCCCRMEHHRNPLGALRRRKMDIFGCSKSHGITGSFSSLQGGAGFCPWTHRCKERNITHQRNIGPLRCIFGVRSGDLQILMEEVPPIAHVGFQFVYGILLDRTPETNGGVGMCGKNKLPSMLIT